MNTATLPIYGTQPTTIEVRQNISFDSEYADLMKELFNDVPLVSVFPQIKVELEHPACLPRKSKEAITLEEFYKRVFFMPPDSQVVIVIHNVETDQYRLYNTEIVNLLDYEMDKGILSFYSIDLSKGKLIEYSQIANAIFEDHDGDWCMVRKHHNQLIKINSATPIFLDTTYGRKKVDNVITFSGHIASSEKPQLYIGLVIDE